MATLLSHDDDGVGSNTDDSDQEIEGHEEWRRYSSAELADIRAYYDNWSQSYEHDVVSRYRYSAPSHVVRAYLDAAKTSSTIDRDQTRLAILDAGAGSGLVGIELARAIEQLNQTADERQDRPSWAIERLVALDISGAMLQQCRSKHVYTQYVEAPLGEPLIMFDSSTFDAVLCCGTFAKMGPSPADTIPEFMRITKPTGLIAFTIRTDYYDGNREQFDSLLATLTTRRATSKYLSLLSCTDPEAYVPNAVSHAMYRVWIYRVCV